MPREAARKVITDAMVRKVKPAAKGKRDEYWDAVIPGFGLRVTDAGGKSFFLRTRSAGGQLRMSWSYPATSLEVARAEAKAALDDAARGLDPKARKEAEKRGNAERAENTFGTVAGRFLRQYAEPRLAKATVADYRRILLGKTTEKWAKRPVSAITRADVRGLVDAIVEKGHPIAANNTLAYLSKFFNWCAEKELVEVPPTDRVKKPAPPTVGDRTLSETEIAEVWRAFEAEGGVFADLFKTLLLTGQRRNEVAGMSRVELGGLDGDRPTWEIPKERTKNGRPHCIPLSSLARKIIEGRPEVGGSGLLFTTTGTTHVSAFSKAKDRIDGHIAKKREQSGLPAMPAWTLHDLRRTMVTMMNECLRIPPHVVEACVNHVSGSAKAGVAGVYNKALYLEERKAAFEAWAGFVQGLIAPEEAESNVVKLRG